MEDLGFQSEVQSSAECKVNMEGVCDVGLGQGCWPRQVVGGGVHGRHLSQESAGREQ